MATETQRNCLLEPYIARVNAKTNFPFECEWLNNQKIKLRSVVYPGEGSGNPLQYPCLENPWTEEPGRLQSMGLQRVGHDLATKQQWSINTVSQLTSNRKHEVIKLPLCIK